MTTAKYSFDEEFQSCVVALALRDVDFCIRTDGLIRPEYFTSEIEGSLFAIWQDHFQTYRRLPADPGVIKEVLKKGIVESRIRKDMISDVKGKLISLVALDIDDSKFIIDKVAEFAKHQALSDAILRSVDLIEKGDFNKVEEIVRKANEVGCDNTLGVYDYVGESAGRKTYRDDLTAGRIIHSGIPTGIGPMDAMLYHRGWGRKELSLIMGGAKSGKTTMLIDAARAACLLGYNILYVTLEVASKIVAERLDASISEIPFSEIGIRSEEAFDAVNAAMAKGGAFKLHEFPSGSMTPQNLNRLISRYKSMSIKFDLVVVDYADLMIPTRHMDDTIENSKRIYIDLRGIAQEHDLAMLTATQTNREGMKAAIAKMTDISDDINKARTCDLLISINATADEVTKGIRRLYFAASRNQAADITIKIQTALDRGKFIARILSVD